MVAPPAAGAAAGVSALGGRGVGRRRSLEQGRLLGGRRLALGLSGDRRLGDGAGVDAGLGRAALGGVEGGLALAFDGHPAGRSGLTL